jgi:hypothetical protein
MAWARLSPKVELIRISCLFIVVLFIFFFLRLVHDLVEEEKGDDV